MKHFASHLKIMSLFLAGLLVLNGCHKEPEPEEPLSWLEEETYAGGKLGTTFNRSSSVIGSRTFSFE